MWAIESVCIGGVLAATAWRWGRTSPTSWREVRVNG
jgi:hypothetical protein